MQISLNGTFLSLIWFSRSYMNPNMIESELFWMSLNGLTRTFFRRMEKFSNFKKFWWPFFDIKTEPYTEISSRPRTMSANILKKVICDFVRRWLKISMWCSFLMLNNIGHNTWPSIFFEIRKFCHFFGIKSESNQ